MNFYTYIIMLLLLVSVTIATRNKPNLTKVYLLDIAITIAAMCVYYFNKDYATIIYWTGLIVNTANFVVWT